MFTKAGPKYICNQHQKNTDRLREKSMSSMMIMWKAMKQEEQKRVIRERKTQGRTLIDGGVLLQFPKIKSE